MVQEERRFPEQVEYITSVAGWRGPAEEKESRWDYGLGRGGELVMSSDICIMRSDPETGILELDMVFPGISVDDVVSNTGWSLDTSKARQMDPPTEDELRALRMLVDPSRIYLGRKSKREAAAAAKQQEGRLPAPTKGGVLEGTERCPKPILNRLTLTRR